MSVVRSVKRRLSGDSDGDTGAGDDEQGALVDLLLAIRRSFLLFVIALGVVMIAGGVLMEFAIANQGVLAAMLVIWGTSAVIFGVLGFGALVALGLR